MSPKKKITSSFFLKKTTITPSPRKSKEKEKNKKIKKENRQRQAMLLPKKKGNWTKPMCTCTWAFL